MPQGGSSQAFGFAALLIGGVGLMAAVRGDSFVNVLAGKKSPIRPLTSSIPSSFAGGGTGTSNASLVTPSTGGNKANPTHATHAALGANGYAYPLGSGWTEERTDQGVDFAPSHTGAPIYSPGNAKVIQVGAPGWPSGEKGVLLHLLDGPLAGKNVFIFEAIHPTVAVGQIVHAGEQVGYGVFGETGIEVGFADESGTPLSHAEYTEGKETVWGIKMREWLHKLRGGK